MKDLKNMPITEIKGIGPKKAGLLAGLGISDLDDVLYSFPREYEDRTNVKAIEELVPGETAMVTARILAIKKGTYIRGRQTATRLLIGDDTGKLEVLYFNAAYLVKTLHAGAVYTFFGKVNENRGSICMLQPQMSKEGSDEQDGDILPIYPLTAGISQKDRRKLTREALRRAEEVLFSDGGTPDELNEDIRTRNGLCGIEYALKNIHFPEDSRHMNVAKYRLIFEELLLFGLGLALMKNITASNSTEYVVSEVPFEEEIMLGLPYRLTDDQYRTVKEICSDMASGRRLNRLVQGDVGSGKTVVSAAAIYRVVKNGWQAALMAPTEILAEQHFEAFTEMFRGRGINICLLTSGISAAERREALKGIADGSIDLIIGTHAIFGREVEYKELALVVTDEQHRFGVEQREALSDKGRDPHILVMTATPIPRTLALILYGDMDISLIRQKPAGRKEIETKVYKGSERNRAMKKVREELDKGGQAYIVTPLIESSESVNARSTEEVYMEAMNTFAPYKTAMLHGRMKADEKDSIMQEFKAGNIQVLVSTVVIEVGINVPNATVMVIENSERFGLAQMHQLRGRVGRGDRQSYCMLILDNDSEVAVKRSEVMAATSDGFEIAEQDLILRGTGEFFGARQHGVPEMRIADVLRHRKILKRALEEAAVITADDPLLEKEENRILRERIYRMYGNLNPGL